jgi:septum formation protein
MTLILASASPTRAALLARAGIAFEAVAPRVDEAALAAGLLAEGTAPRDLADALAEAKALKVSQRYPGRLVLGADQVLEHRGEALFKPADAAALEAQLRRLRGETHRLWSAAVMAEGGRPLWRHVGGARLTMRAFSDAYLAAYLRRNGAVLTGTVGGYRIEEEGVRLFARIEGDGFTIQGLPLVEIAAWLAAAGAIEG